jgi:hypothetical protein
MNIKEAKFTFSESFSFNPTYREKPKKIYVKVGLEALNCIPIVSGIMNGKELITALKKRDLWVHNADIYNYDVRVSVMNITRLFLTILGLGIFLVPVKSIATIIHKDIENPHFLDDESIKIIQKINELRETTYENGIRNFPEEQKYFLDIKNRDPIKYPLIRKNLYASKEEKKAEKRMEPIRRKFLDEEKQTQKRINTNRIKKNLRKLQKEIKKIEDTEKN